MSADRARRMAENADAVSEYAALGRDELREEGEDGSLWHPQADAVEHHLVADGLRSPVVVIAGGGWVSLVPRLWCRAQANSSPSNSGPMAMGAGR
jgi:hypothetical protein